MLTYLIRWFFVLLYRSWLHVAQCLFRSSDAVLELDVSGVSEQPMPFSWLGDGGNSLLTYRRLLKRAANDPNIEGVILRVRQLDDTGFGVLEELREQVRKFSRSGKFTVASLDSVGTRAYYLASICDRIVMNPTAALGPLGLDMQQSFLKGTLDKLGIRSRLERIGEYKSAPEMFNREEMSPEHEEMVNWLLDDLYEEVVTEVHARRGLSRESVFSLFDEGFLTASQALEGGLVDDVVHQNDLEEWVREQAGAYNPVQADTYTGRRLPAEVSWRSPRRIAVLYADGPIHSGNGRVLPDSTVGDETMLKTLRDLRDSGRYEGILFRVNSPGGSAVASDKIAREVQRTQEEASVPVVTAMAGVAGSGGYYISALSETIYANRTTITGSIGVVMGKFTIEELQDQMGYRTQHVTRGERADMNSPTRDWKPEEREKVVSLMEHTYDRFVDVVEEGRDQSRERIEEVAQGKVWTGRQAKEHKLVDHLGGFDDALRHLRSRAGITDDAPIRLDPYPVNYLNLFDSMVGVVLRRVKSVLFRWIVPW
jgi:protease-4